MASLTQPLSAQQGVGTDTPETGSTSGAVVAPSPAETAPATASTSDSTQPGLPAASQAPHGPPPTAAFAPEPSPATVKLAADTGTIPPSTAATQPAAFATPPDRDENVESSARSQASSNGGISQPPPVNHGEEPSDDIIRLGPVVGVGLPSLLSLGGMLKLTRYLGFGVTFGLIPSMHISFYGEATVSYQEYDVHGRIFPFGGGFFLGAGVGYATIKGTLSSKYDTTSYISSLPISLPVPNPLVYEAQGSIRTMIVTPQIGYFYTTSVGFSIGLDFGAQVPIAPSEIENSSQLNLAAETPQQVRDAIQTQYVDPTDRKVHDTLETLGRTPLPTVNLRIGWLF